MLTSQQITELNNWIDNSPANRQRDPEAALWGRVSKVMEEHGEVLEAIVNAQGQAVGRAIAALIGATGQNPRKGVTHTLDDVRKELLDVALTALCAVEHLDGGGGVAMAALQHHIDATYRRAGLDQS
jgi:NTP pyrophosphatase (non-canonical NTP hydrolase)